MNLKEIIKNHHANDAGFCRHYLALYSMVLGMETKSVFEKEIPQNFAAMNREILMGKKVSL